MLAGLLMASWDKETKKNTIDALASYRGKALTIFSFFHFYGMGQRT
jgi:hypothetical protein